jgi:hypothetical protein
VGSKKFMCYSSCFAIDKQSSIESKAYPSGKKLKCNGSRLRGFQCIRVVFNVDTILLELIRAPRFLDSTSGRAQLGLWPLVIPKRKF